MRWLRARLHLTLLGGGMMSSLAAQAEDAPVPTPPSELRVITYNVLADAVHVEQRVPALLAILRESNADVIALQEVAPWFLDLILHEEWMHRYQRARRDTKTVLAREFLILSRFPITDFSIHRLPTNQWRSMFRVTLDIAGPPTVFATTHLDSMLEDGAMRAQQLDAISAQLAACDEAFFLGDLNFGDRERPESAHLPAGFRDVWLATRPGEPGFTWDLKKSPWARHESFPGEPSRRLDRILVKSTRWLPVSAKILGDEPAPGKAKNVFPSDHFGLLAIFRRLLMPRSRGPGSRCVVRATPVLRGPARARPLQLKSRHSELTPRA